MPGSSSYNALQAELKKSLSSGLFFLASYTWSKSLDIESSGQDGSIENFYDLHRDWGPSGFDRRQMLVLSGVYALPVGRGQAYISNPNRFVQTLAGNWNMGSIVGLISGTAFNVSAGGDVSRRWGRHAAGAEGGRIPTLALDFSRSRTQWLNKSAFAIKHNNFFRQSSIGDDLVGPAL